MKRLYSNTQWGSVLLLAVCVAGQLRASGPCLPDALLENGGNSIIGTPEFFFQTELRALAGRYQNRRPLYHPIRGKGNEETVRADEADFARALAENRITPQDPAGAVLRHREARRFLNAVPPREGPLPPEDDSEFRDYHEGALAYRRHDLASAGAAFRRLLERPAGQRHYRTVWACYMLARIAAEGGAKDEAARQCQALRKAIDDGFADTTDCYSASLRLEAASDEALRWELALQEMGMNPGQAVLTGVVGSLLAKLTDAELERRARVPVLREITTCELLGGASSYWRPNASDEAKAACARWLAAVGKAEAGEVADADRLAWLAYLAGDSAKARGWLGLLPEPTALSWWLQAKLEVRAGHTDKAVAAMKQCLALRPVDERLEFMDCDAVPFVSTIDSARGDQALLLMASGRFRESVGLFLEGRHWLDAAWVAERLMTTDELKRYLDQHRPWDAAREEVAMKFEALTPADYGYKPTFLLCLTNWTQAATIPQEFFTYRLRWLLARRLQREGRGAEAVAYYPQWLRPTAVEYRQVLREVRLESRPKAERARSWWRAAWLARTQGLELLGTEREPDNVAFDGQYEAPATRKARLDGKFLAYDPDWEHPKPPAEVKVGLPATALERRRLRDLEQPPDQRWHYRLTAATYAWRAARLMPDHTEELADVLNSAGRWHFGMTGGERLSQKFYNAIEARCADTALGRKVLERKNFTQDHGPLTGPLLGEPPPEPSS